MLGVRSGGSGRVGAAGVVVTAGLDQVEGREGRDRGGQGGNSNDGELHLGSDDRELSGMALGGDLTFEDCFLRKSESYLSLQNVKFAVNACVNNE